MPRHDASGRARQFDQRSDLGIDRALSLGIGIPAAPGLLAEAARFAEPVGDVDIALRRIARRREPLATRPGDLQASEVEYRERPHGEAVTLHSRIDLMRQRPVLNHEFGLAAVGRKNAVADETFADA